MVGIFIAIVSIILLAHTVNAVVFKLELRPEDRPFAAAYLFPLLQLYRLAAVVWRKRTFNGLKSLKSEHKNNLFNLLAIALETAPHLGLQFTVFLMKFAQGQASKVLYISLFASFLSGTVNGGILMLSTLTTSTSQNPNWRQKTIVVIVGGMFTLSALILECVTISALILWKGWISPVSFLLLEFSMYYCLFHFSIFNKGETGDGFGRGRFCSGKRILQSSSWAYISMTMGPLYPMVSNMKSRGEPSTEGEGAYANLARLTLVVGLHLSVDVAIFILSLAGPQFCQWSYYCIQIFHVRPHHVVCSFYMPTTTFGIITFIFSFLFYIYLSTSIEGELIHNKSQSDSSTNQEVGDKERGQYGLAKVPTQGSRFEYKVDIFEQHQCIKGVLDETEDNNITMTDTILQNLASPFVISRSATSSSIMPIISDEHLHTEDNDEIVEDLNCHSSCSRLNQGVEEISHYPKNIVLFTKDNVCCVDNSMHRCEETNDEVNVVQNVLIHENVVVFSNKEDNSIENSMLTCEELANEEVDVIQNKPHHENAMVFIKENIHSTENSLLTNGERDEEVDVMQKTPHHIEAPLHLSTAIVSTRPQSMIGNEYMSSQCHVDIKIPIKENDGAVLTRISSHKVGLHEEGWEKKVDLDIQIPIETNDGAVLTRMSSHKVGFREEGWEKKVDPHKIMLCSESFNSSQPQGHERCDTSNSIEPTLPTP